MRLPLLLALALCLPSSLWAQATPAERIAARTGAALSPETRRYFGLLPDAPPGTAVDLAPTPDGGLTLALRAPGSEPATRTLTPELAEDLARYVDRYEALFWNAHDDSDITQDLGPSLTRLRRERLAVPATLRREVIVPHTLQLRTGDRLTGRPLYADEQVIVLWTSRAPYHWRDAAALEIVPVSAVADIEVARVYRLAIAAGLGLSAAAMASALGSPRQTQATVAGIALGGTAWRVLTDGPSVRASIAGKTLYRNAFFRNGAPPEFRTRLAERAALAPPPAAAVRDRSNRGWAFPISLSMTASRLAERAPASETTTRYTSGGVLNAFYRSYDVVKPVLAEEPTWSVDGQVTAVLPGLALAGSPVRLVVGGSRTFFDALEPRPVVGPQPLDGREANDERIVDRQEWSAYGGVTVGGRRRPFYGSRVLLGAGMRRLSATLDGEASTSATRLIGQALVSRPQTWTYGEPLRATVPFLRTGYEFLVTPFSSVYVRAEWAAPATFEQPERTFARDYPEYQFGIRGTRDAHRVRVGGTNVTAGLALHL